MKTQFTHLTASIISIVVLVSTYAFGLAPSASAKARTPRAVIANQPDFVADLVTTDLDGSVERMQLAKKGTLYRLDYPSNEKVEFINNECLAWRLDPETKVGKPDGRSCLIFLLAPWILFDAVAAAPCSVFEASGLSRNRDGKPEAIRMFVPEHAEDPMMCYVSWGRGLVTRIEFPTLRPTELGARTYELKNVRYTVPADLFDVQLLPQPRDDNESWRPECAT